MDDLAKLKQQKQALDKKLLKMEDKVFGQFCKRLKINSIRQYEDISMHEEQANSQKKMEYVSAKAKFENMIRFDSKRLEDAVEREKRLEQKLAQLKKSDEKTRKKESTFQQKLESLFQIDLDI